MKTTEPAPGRTRRPLIATIAARGALLAIMAVAAALPTFAATPPQFPSAPT